MDMVGYSRLIGLDDAGTLKRLRALRKDLMDPAIAEHGGRIVQTGGDSLLIIFDSIDGAVRCALKVQQQVPTHDRDHPPDCAIRFRVGINIGDAIADGTDLHGDAVNVAARLQAECPPGGICVTRAVRDHMRDRLDLAFEELGALNLKNILRPVEAFVVRPDAAATASKSVEQSLLRGGHEALLLPDKPSVAVLAFTNMSGDPEQEYFSDGMAEDIITQLSRSRALFVIARNSSFTYKGRAVDVKQIGLELGVRYVLEGSVRRAGERLRISAQLVEAETGNHIWAERYDRALADVFAVQDEISDAVATAIGPAVADAEMHRAMRRPPESLDAWELYQRGMWHLGKNDSAANDAARSLFERAIELDPMFAAAYVGLAASCLWAGAQYQTMPLDEATRLAATHARKAVELDPGDADAQAALAGTLMNQGDADNAEAIARQALAINPNCAWARYVMGLVLIFAGRTTEGRDALGVFERVSPRDGAIAAAHSIIGISYYFERDYERCVEAARRQLSAHPGYTLTYRWLAAALGQLGRTEEARAALAAVSLGEFDVYVRNRVPWMRPQDYENMLDGLRKAGWQG
jgi:adenylate cyclase